jgi:hypothetical protein
VRLQREFDVAAARAEAGRLVAEAARGLGLRPVARPFTADCTCSDELWAAVAALPSPRRARLAGPLALLDAVLPPLRREHAALAVQGAVRARAARAHAERLRAARFAALVLRLQCNFRVALARRALPRARRRRAEEAEAARAAREREEREAWLAGLEPAQVPRSPPPIRSRPA